MKLHTIDIKNFKSIKSLNLKFSGNLYCLVGKNETGKSNILKAIECLHSYDSKKFGENIKEIFLPNTRVEGVFAITPQEKVSLHAKVKSLNFNTISYNTQALSFIKIILEGSSYKEDLVFVFNDNQEISARDLKEPRDKVNAAISNLMPSIEYFENEEFLLEPFDVKKYLEDSNNPSFQSFQRLLRLGGLTDFKALTDLNVEDIILIREEISDQVNSFIEKYYKSDYALQIKIESHSGIFSIFFRDKYKNLSNLMDRSTGFRYFFSFLINKLYMQKFGRKDSIYLLDEPALSLHPKSQKNFVALLEDASKDNLILYTTHSPFSINRMKPTTVWVVERDAKKGTFINPKPYNHNWRPLRSAIGMDISDSFFYSDKTLIVEGPEDRIYISSLIRYFSSKGRINLNSDLFSIIDAGSISNLPAMVQILLDENRPMMVLMDHDDNKIYNRIKNKEQKINDSELITLKTIKDINETAVSIEDLLPETIYIAAVKSYVQILVNDKIIKRKEFDTDKNISFATEGCKRYQTIANTIVFEYINTDDSELDSKVPISKLGIAHEFEKSIESVELLGTKGEEAICLSLISMISAVLKLS